MNTANNSITDKSINQQSDLANITIQLATVINKHLAEQNPSCSERGHDIHSIIKEVFFGQ
jgi:hypothetical protein